MKKTFKYRIYPTPKQEKALLSTLWSCRWLYNKGLEIKNKAFKDEKRSISKYDMFNLLPELKVENPKLNSVYSQVCQNVFDRLDLAYKAFFRRVKSGETPGFPRFKGFDRYDSITYPQKGFRITNNGKLELSKIGVIKMVYHRSYEGILKTCTIRRSTTGKWWVSFTCDNIEPKLLVPVNKAVGIDLGIENYAYFSDDTVIENPKFAKEESDALAKEQRRLSKLQKGSIERKLQRKVVARVHERISFKRDDFCHKLSRFIVNGYDQIFFEDLSIDKMIAKGYTKLRYGILDASWGKLAQFTAFKAEEAGRLIGFVNPAYTSQKCSGCGTLVKKDLKVRIHECPNCGLRKHRDSNASSNILGLGLQSVGEPLLSVG